MRVHFIAIGGSAMHSLALALQRRGDKVTGSDDAIFEPSKSRLADAGLLPDRMGWDANRVTADIDGVVLGMALSSKRSTTFSITISFLRALVEKESAS